MENKKVEIIPRPITDLHVEDVNNYSKVIGVNNGKAVSFEVDKANGLAKIGNDGKLSESVLPKIEIDSQIHPINLSTETPTKNGVFEPLEVGIYTNFGGLELTQQEKDSSIVYFYLLNGVFSKQVKSVSTTDVVGPNNTNAISSRGVYNFSIRNVSNIAELRTIVGEEGQKVNLLGYYEAGDKPELLYKWVSGEAEDDVGSVIKVGEGYWSALFVESVDIRDFGANKSFVNNSVYVQKSIDYAVLKNIDVVNNIECNVIDQIFIDRKVDDRKYENFFTIKSTNGKGKFIVTKDSELSIFSSRYTFNGTPNTQLIRFENITFNGDVDNLKAFVLNGSVFLRTYFVGCNFMGIRLLKAHEYIQSIYLINCNVRMFRGYFVESLERTYDFKFLGGMIEAGQSGFKLEEPYGCAICQSVIEGMYGTGILFNGSEGIDISGNYFEANKGGDVNMLGVKINNGVNISGNFLHTTEDGVYSVLWGKTNGGVSIGNSSLSRLHYFASENDAKNVLINDSAKLSLSNVNVPKHYKANGAINIIDNSGAELNITKTYSFYEINGRTCTFQIGLVFPESTDNRDVNIKMTNIISTTTLGTSISGYSTFNSKGKIIILDGINDYFTLLNSDMVKIKNSEMSKQSIKLVGTFFIDN